MFVRVTIDRLEGDKAVLVTDDKTNIIWPKNKLPKGAKEGVVLQIAVAFDGKKEGADKELAKSILNEILNSSEKE